MTSRFKASRKSLVLIPPALMVLGWVVGSSPSLLAQRSDTVYRTDLLDNVEVTTVSAEVEDIGQGMHQTILIFTDNSPNTCVAHTTDIFFEGSYDGLTFVPFGSRLTTIDAGLIEQIFAFGAYPRVRINPATFDTTNCELTAHYSGTLYPTNFLSIAKGQSQFEFFNINTAASGDLTVVAARAGLRACVYELFLWNPTAMTVTLQSSAAPSAGELNVPLALPANVGFVLDNQDTPRFCTVAGDAFIINLSAALQLSGWANFAYE